MKALDTRTLITGLQATLREQKARLEELRQLPLDVLQTRPALDRWSVMEVIEHMVLSSGHYHTRLQRLYGDENNGLRFRTGYTPGFWGQYMVDGMRPDTAGAIKWKMRTLRFFEPRNVSTRGHAPMDGFEEILSGFLGLLERARSRGLEGERVVSTLGPILRFKAGDAFRFPVAHQERHMLQIERTLAQLSLDPASGNTTRATAGSY